MTVVAVISVQNQLTTWNVIRINHESLMLIVKAVIVNKLDLFIKVVYVNIALERLIFQCIWYLGAFQSIKKALPKQCFLHNAWFNLIKR
jgi:hypothetical protein